MSAPTPPTSITIILVPHHVGLQNHRVGLGPARILSRNLTSRLNALKIPIHYTEIGRVQDDFEGEMGRSFEVLRQISSAVSSAVSNSSFPLVLAGNCMSSVGVAAGLHSANSSSTPAFVYLDAHDDYNTPSSNTNGYFDAMGLSMLAGESYHALVNTIPGFVRLEDFSKFVYCGLRDVTEVERSRVEEAGMKVIWGGDNAPLSFSEKLDALLEQRKEDFKGDTITHLDLDVLDQTEGLVNGYESSGGIFQDDLIRCLETVSKRVEKPAALTVCSFNPEQGDGRDGDRIADIGVRAIVAFVKSMVENGQLVATE